MSKFYLLSSPVWPQTSLQNVGLPCVNIVYPLTEFGFWDHGPGESVSQFLISQFDMGQKWVFVLLVGSTPVHRPNNLAIGPAVAKRHKDLLVGCLLAPVERMDHFLLGRVRFQQRLRLLVFAELRPSCHLFLCPCPCPSFPASLLWVAALGSGLEA